MATCTVDPADLKVYNNGGLIIRHVSPPYSAVQVPAVRLAPEQVVLKFTYTPFAANFLVGVSYIPWSVRLRLSPVANWLLIRLAAVALRTWRAAAAPRA